LTGFAVIFEIVLAALTGFSFGFFTIDCFSSMPPLGLAFLGESFDAFGGVVGFH